MNARKIRLLVATILLCLATITGLFACTDEKNTVPSGSADSIEFSDNNASDDRLPSDNGDADASEGSAEGENKTTTPAQKNEENPESAQLPDTSNKDSYFEIHFIDVGQADAALVICDGENMLIDGGNSADSSTIYTYLKKNGVSELEYIIATHAHEDHVGGLSGALNFATAKNAFCPVTEYDSKAFSDFVKNLKKQGLGITVPKVGDKFNIGSASVSVLAANSAEGTNNSSIVLKIVYGKTSFLFTGDAEYETEAFMAENGSDLASTLLKVGHHGSSTSTSYRFLWEVMPEYAVISVGKNNDYGHPHDEVVSRLNDADVTVYRTDIAGDIICKSDGSELSFEFSDNRSPQQEKDTSDKNVPASATDNDHVSETDTTVSEQKRSMVLNTNSKKYHESGCKSISSIKDENRKDVQYTTSEVEALGYLPCGNCH